MQAEDLGGIFASTQPDLSNVTGSLSSIGT